MKIKTCIYLLLLLCISTIHSSQEPIHAQEKTVAFKVLEPEVCSGLQLAPQPKMAPIHIAQEEIQVDHTLDAKDHLRDMQGLLLTEQIQHLQEMVDKFKDKFVDEVIHDNIHTQLEELYEQAKKSK